MQRKSLTSPFILSLGLIIVPASETFCHSENPSSASSSEEQLQRVKPCKIKISRLVQRQIQSFENELFNELLGLRAKVFAFAVSAGSEPPPMAEVTSLYLVLMVIRSHHEELNLEIFQLQDSMKKLILMTEHLPVSDQKALMLSLSLAIDELLHRLTGSVSSRSN